METTGSKIRAHPPPYKHSREVALLIDGSAALLQGQDPLALIDELYSRIGKLLGVEMYVHFAVSEDGEYLELAASGGLTAQQQASIGRMSFNQAVCGAVAHRRDPMIVNAVQDSRDPLVGAIKALGVRAYACHPLIAHDYLFGTLSFGTRSRDEFDQDAVDLMRAVSNLVALALDRHRTERNLRDSDRRKEDFLAVLSHELRNPLAPLRTGVDLLEHARRQPELLDTLAPMMERQLSHLTRLVDDLLDIERVRRGRIALRKAPLELQHVARAAVEQMEKAMAERGHDLTVTLPDVALPVYGDFERLTQVIANLLSNAAKYTEIGGVIKLSVTEEDAQAVVRVLDNGHGIPAHRFGVLFDFYNEVPEHIGITPRTGMGVGLALSQQLVRMHGGLIEVESEGLGRGSQFIVRLPMGDAGKVLEKPASGEAGVPVPHRIMIVDDNADAADSLAIVLKMNGHTVSVAYDAETALERWQQVKPEIVFLDIGLPGMDGMEAAHQMRRLQGDEAVRLIALTGRGQEVDRERAKAAHFDDLLTKPVNAALLLDMLQ